MLSEWEQNARDETDELDVLGFRRMQRSPVGIVGADLVALSLYAARKRERERY